MKKLFCLLLFLPAGLLAQDHPWFDPSRTFEDRASLLVDAMTAEEKIEQTLYNAPAIPRLGLPAYNWWNEALHGVARNGRATVFPQAIGMAATFDPELIERVAIAISDEARAKFNEAIKIDNRTRYAGLTFWSPNVNIFRDPRWGRGQETYGEDPFLTGQLGMAFVRGLQGDDPKYLKTAACAKHYAVHSGPEKLRHSFNAEISMKDLRETYLPAFEDLVTKAKVEGVMGAYNRTLGEPCAGSTFLLQDILRQEWGFNGYIVSDCWGLLDFHLYHKVTNTAEESAAKALNSGTNLNCGVVFNQLGGAINQKLTTEEQLDTSLKQLLLTRFRLGFFDPPQNNRYTQVAANVVGSPQHQALAREVATKSIVLLKNDGVLPLRSDIGSLYVTGPHASSEEVLIGNYYGLSANTVSILDGLVNRVSLGTTIDYRPGVLPYRQNVNPVDWTTGDAKQADAIIAVMGISGWYEGEEGESIVSNTQGDKTDLKLPQNQIDFVKKLKADNEKPVILVLTGGSPIAIPELHDLVDAVLFVWYPGEQGGNAVADVVFGDVSPSGRLPITFPKSIDQLPPYQNYDMKGRTYRYMTDEPLYPFGFGLSYTGFEYSEPSVKMSGGRAMVTAAVKNIGPVDADEVSQLYITSPAGGKGDPIYSLKGVRRSSLGPGESGVLAFYLDEEAFLQFEEDGHTVKRKGVHKIWIGGSSPSQRCRDLGSPAGVSIDFEARKYFK